MGGEDVPRSPARMARRIGASRRYTAERCVRRRERRRAARSVVAHARPQAREQLHARRLRRQRRRRGPRPRRAGRPRRPRTRRCRAAARRARAHRHDDRQGRRRLAQRPPGRAAATCPAPSVDEDDAVGAAVRRGAQQRPVVAQRSGDDRHAEVQPLGCAGRARDRRARGACTRPSATWPSGPAAGEPNARGLVAVDLARRSGRRGPRPRRRRARRARRRRAGRRRPRRRARFAGPVGAGRGRRADRAGEDDRARRRRTGSPSEKAVSSSVSVPWVTTTPRPRRRAAAAARVGDQQRVRQCPCGRPGAQDALGAQVRDGPQSGHGRQQCLGIERRNGPLPGHGDRAARGEDANGRAPRVPILRWKRWYSCRSASACPVPPSGTPNMDHQHQPPQADGLYDPRFEHDACGVAMVARLDNQPQPRGRRARADRAGQPRAPRRRGRRRQDRRRRRDPHPDPRRVLPRGRRLRAARAPAATASASASCRATRRAARSSRSCSSSTSASRASASSAGATCRRRGARRRHRQLARGPHMRQLFIEAGPGFERRPGRLRAQALRHPPHRRARGGPGLLRRRASPRARSSTRGCSSRHQVRDFFPDLDRRALRLARWRSCTRASRRTPSRAGSSPTRTA